MSKEGFPGGCNPADVLYKLAHSRGIKPPIFEMISEQGPPHARTFTWSCSFFEGKYHTMAAGKSKKEAKNAVAKALIDRIEISDLPEKKKAGGGPQKTFNQNMRGGKRKMAEMEPDSPVVSSENGAHAVPVGSGKKKNKRRPGNTVVQQSFPAHQQQMMMQQMADFNNDSMMPFMMGFGAPLANPMIMMQTAALGMGMGMPMMPNMMGMPMGMPMNPSRTMAARQPPTSRPIRLKMDDQLVMEKHKKIYPTKDELGLILKLAVTAEKSLQRASDKMCIKKETKIVDGKEKIEEKIETNREIMGVARVGDLSKGLLLTGDRAVNMVVMCRDKPTIHLLERISAEVEKDLKNRPASETTEENKFQELDLEVHTFQEEGGFCVVLNKEGETEPYAVNVTLTCTKMREKKKEVEKDEAETTNGDSDQVTVKTEKSDEPKEEKTDDEKNKPEEDTPDPVDMLPKDKCTKALAELRRAKWFSTVAANMESCSESIRIIKDLSKRAPEWLALGDWAIELLVERALFSCRRPMSPSESVLRVFEAVASGIFAPDGNGIKDPCEREVVDVARHLSNQERENLAASAQKMVRMVHFRQVHKILDLPKPPTFEERKAAEKAKEEAKAAAAAAAAAANVSEAGETVVKAEAE